MSKNKQLQKRVHAARQYMDECLHPRLGAVIFQIVFVTLASMTAVTFLWNIFK